MTLSEELQWRGFVNQTTFTDLTVLDGEPITFYWGVDPSATSMTIGNFALAMMVRHFIDYGHKPVLLVGGATGLIGDPDGKAEERDLKSINEISKNKEGIAAQYDKIFAGKSYETVDNYEWFQGIGYLDFLRDVGKHVPMRQMLGRDFVQSRLGEDGVGISYAEFSYSLIQGYDFLHLYREKGVTLQVAGADQWGNSIAGVELVRRIAGGEAHVWTAPLVINKATGKKFGKTEDGAIWLDSALTSVYKFYQFWLNVNDDGVFDYMKIYTLLSRDEIEAIQTEFTNNRSGRLAQKSLAYEVTKIVHGSKRADAVRRVSEVLFGGASYDSLQPHDFELLTDELPHIERPDGVDLIQVVVDLGLASSNSEARRFIEQGAVSINGQQFRELSGITMAQTLGGYAVVRRGKNTSGLLSLI